jgi:Flp pilus assembly pilin Flp
LKHNVNTQQQRSTNSNKEDVMKKINELYGKMWTTLRSEVGATMVEYALMVVAIALVAIVGVKLVGTQLNTTYGTTIAGKIAAP